MNDIHDQEPTLQDVLDAVNESSTAIEGRLQKMEVDLSGVKSDVTSLKSDVTYVKSMMVTKEYLDDRVNDLKGDLVVLMRKEDTKVRALVELLQKKNVISEDDVKQILSMDPFPQTA